MAENEQIVSPEVEAEAREQGWVPKDEFRGKEEDWRDAVTFVKIGKDLNPILRKNNERFKAELEKTKKDLEELRKVTEEFKQHQKIQAEAREQSLKTEIAALKKEKAAAVSAGDGEKVNEIDDRIDEIREEERKAKESPPPKPAPQAEAKELTAWKEKNHWYVEDVTMAAAANALAESIVARTGLRGQAFLDELDKVLEETFTPEKLGKKVAPRSPVERGTPPSNPPNGNKKTYENLPADAKAACDRFVKQKILTRDQYVADYAWD